MDESFTKLHTDFMEKYWSHFEDEEENKLVYFDIFQEYNNVIEKYIESELIKNFTNFDMKEFVTDLCKRKDDLDGEIFEVLDTFNDFLAFKEKFLDYRAMKEGKTADFSSLFIISKLSDQIET